MRNSKTIRQQAKKHGARGRAKQIPKTALTVDPKIGQKVSDAYDNFEPEEIDEEAQQYMRVPEAATVNREIFMKCEEWKRDQDAAVAEAAVVANGDSSWNENPREYDDNVQTSSGWISRDGRTESKAAPIERTTNCSAASEGSSSPNTASSSNSTDITKSEKHQVADGC